MSQPHENPTADLCRALEQPAGAVSLPQEASTVVVAGAMSLLIHAILVFNAAVFTFVVPVSKEAELRLAKGQKADTVEVQLSMAPPPPMPTPVKPEALKTPPPPVQPPPMTQKVDPPKEEPFEKTPPPAREPVDGAAPGNSPLANRVLEGDSAEPEAMAPPQPVNRTPGTTPPTTALKPVEIPKEKSTRSAPSLATNQVPTQSPASKPVETAKPIEVTFAALPPTIEFTPPTITPPVSPAPPVPPTPVTPPAPATSRPATAGVTAGVEADLVKPRYPQLSIRAGEEGIILLEIEVLPDGSVGFVRVIESPGFDRLEKAAIDAVRRSKFVPAQRNGVAVREVVRKTIGFRLTDV